jgi:fatty acid desaturase
LWTEIKTISPMTRFFRFCQEALSGLQGAKDETFEAFGMADPGRARGLLWPVVCQWPVLWPDFPVLALGLMTVATALHSSLQHEALHGHPTRSAAVNELLVALPLGVFYPYRRFRQMHLGHHNDER